MVVTGNASTQTGGVEYFFVADGRTPSSVTIRYKIDTGTATVTLQIFDVSAAAADAQTTGLSSSSLATGSIASGISGTYTAGSKFRVRAIANVDAAEIIWLGDVIVAY